MDLSLGVRSLLVCLERELGKRDDFSAVASLADAILNILLVHEYLIYPILIYLCL